MKFTRLPGRSGPGVAARPGQIAYVSMVRTGSRDEVEPGRSGFAHFFEHMMFRGTEKYPTYDAVTAAMGAARNAFTSNDMTVYYLVASNDYLEQHDRPGGGPVPEPELLRAGLPDGGGRHPGRVPAGRHQPVRLPQRAVRETAFDQHTYRHTTIGFEADVRAMPEGYDYSLDFYRRHYRPENVVLVIAGDFDFDAEAKRLIREYYGDWEPGYVPPEIPGAGADGRRGTAWWSTPAGRCRSCP
jgi:zinc protease